MKRHTQKCSASNPIPACAGIGLRTPHYKEILETFPRTGWFEVHSENYFGAGGQPLWYLEQIRSHYPISLHGVGLSLGSTDPLNREHLRKLKSLVQRIEPGLVSEHLSWSSVGGRYMNDLLPLPYTEESLLHVIERISQTQEFLGRRILIENPSSYLQFVESTIPEWVFLSEVSARSGCGILLDINNIYVSAINHRFDPHLYIQSVPPEKVEEIHLAGFETNEIGLIDTHSRPVYHVVWELYQEAMKQFEKVPTLIEWDSDIPDLSVLLAEACKANIIMEKANAIIA
jgi:uncharacterized protein (UPF0276 family)